MRAFDETIECVLERAKPQTLIDEIGPLHLKLPFGAEHIGRQGEALEFLVGLNQQ